MAKTSNFRTDLSAYDNRWYKPGSRWKVFAWFVVNRLFINTYLPWPMAIKRVVLKTFGAKIGTGVIVKPKVNIKYPWLLFVENHVWIGERVWIDNLADVVLRDNVCLSQGAMLLTGNHDYKKAKFDLRVGKITLEEGVWIGARAVVCAGVTCHSHAMLAVNSVAVKDLEAYSIYQGNPAQWVKKREITV